MSDSPSACVSVCSWGIRTGGRGSTVFGVFPSKSVHRRSKRFGDVKGTRMAICVHALWPWVYVTNTKGTASQPFNELSPPSMSNHFGRFCFRPFSVAYSCLNLVQSTDVSASEMFWYLFLIIVNAVLRKSRGSSPTGWSDLGLRVVPSVRVDTVFVPCCFGVCSWVMMWETFDWFSACQSHKHPSSVWVQKPSSRLFSLERPFQKSRWPIPVYYRLRVCQRLHIAVNGVG